jgi:hypothetical protein
MKKKKRNTKFVGLCSVKQDKSNVLSKIIAVGKFSPSADIHGHNVIPDVPVGIGCDGDIASLGTITLGTINFFTREADSSILYLKKYNLI